MKKTTQWILLAAVVGAGGAGAGYWYWQQERAAERLTVAKAALPTRPDLTGWSPELVRRLGIAEQMCRGEDPLGGLQILAQLYHANGFFGEATQCYGGLMRLDSKQAQWPHRLAALLAGMGQLEQAVAFWQRAVDLDGKYLPARIRWADALLKLNRADEASRVYEAARKLDPANAYTLVGLARVAMENNKLTEARELLESAAESSGSKIGENLLVTVYERLGQRARAEEVRSKAKSAGSFFDMPDPWVDGIYDDCYDAYRLAVAAGTADRAGDTATGLRWLERAAQLAPNYGIIFNQLGGLRAKSGDRAGALKAYRRCVELTPDFGDAWLALLEITKANGDLYAWENLLQEALSKCPTSPSLHLENGRRLKALGRMDEALAEFKESMRLRPTEAVGLYEQALVYFATNRVAEGAAAAKQALEITPDDPLALAMIAMYSVMAGTESEAQVWLRRARNQPRVQREELLSLQQQFQARFGRSPW